MIQLMIQKEKKTYPKRRKKRKNQKYLIHQHEK